MSLVIGMHLGKLVLIASDRREVRAWGDQILCSHDNADKIMSVGIGYITGAGFVDLLDAVKSAIARTEITCTDQILDIVNTQQEMVRRASPFDSDTMNRHIRDTSWMFSYVTEANGCPRLRIGIVSGSLGGQMGFIPEGTAYVFLPNEKTRDRLQQVKEWLGEHLKTTTELPGIAESLEYHGDLLRKVFTDVSTICETVSDRFHIGAMGLKGLMMLSDEIGPSSTCVRFVSSG